MLRLPLRGISSGLLFVFLALIQTAPLLARELHPGVYREYVINTRTGPNWRVTDPGVKRDDAKVFLPNPTFTFKDVNLHGAVRAELTMHHWVGHSGTKGQQIILNREHRIEIPVNEFLVGMPYGRVQYLNDSNPVIEVPIEWLRDGDNTIQGTIAPEYQGKHWWGQWGWYWISLRIWCSEDQAVVPHANVVVDVPGKTITGESIVLRIESAREEAIESVEFFARYHGYDEDGDNKFYDWHGFNVTPDRAEGSVGQDSNAPFSATWDVTWIPDQEPGAISFIAIIRYGENTYRITQPVEGFSLERSHSVQMVAAENFPITLVRNRIEASSLLFIPEEIPLDKVTAARLLIRTWNGENHEHGSTPLRFNRGDYHSGLIKGANHFYALDDAPIDPAWLNQGENQLFLYSDTVHHGCEVLVPGPAILLRLED